MGALALAAAEARRQAGRIDSRGLAVVVALGVLFGGLVAFVPGLGPDPSAALYVVEAAPGTPLRDAAEADGRFRVLEGDGRLLADGAADLLLQGREVRFDAASERSLAALDAYRQALRSWTEARLAGEGDQAAAFPIEITVVYESRGGRAAEPRAAPGATPDPGASPDPGPSPDPDATPDPGTGPAEADLADEARPTGEVRRGLRPDDVEPPFPIRSLLLTFAYVLPASLLVQLHASDMHAERIRHRGVLLLSTPLRPGQILLGKSLPGAAMAITLALLVTIVLGAGPLGFLASLSFIGFLHAGVTLLAFMARSPRELTLMQVAFTTLLNVFLFLPAMFPALPALAFLSPVHVVASSMRGDPIGVLPFIYATLPISLAAVACAVLAAGFLRDEVLFAVGGTFGRVLDAMEHVTRGRPHALLAGFLVVPLVFAAELFVVVTASVLGLQAAVSLFLPLAVAIENVAKGLAGWSRARRARPGLPAWLAGALGGLGFFLAEKAALVLTLASFPEIPFAREALALLGGGGGLVVLLAPALVHVATGTLMGAFAARFQHGVPIGFLLAFGLHLAYDLLLLRVLL